MAVDPIASLRCKVADLQGENIRAHYQIQQLKAQNDIQQSLINSAVQPHRASILMDKVRQLELQNDELRNKLISDTELREYKRQLEQVSQYSRELAAKYEESSRGYNSIIKRQQDEILRLQSIVAEHIENNERYKQENVELGQRSKAAQDEAAGLQRQLQMTLETQRIDQEKAKQLIQRVQSLETEVQKLGKTNKELEERCLNSQKTVLQERRPDNEGDRPQQSSAGKFEQLSYKNLTMRYNTKNSPSSSQIVFPERFQLRQSTNCLKSYLMNCSISEEEADKKTVETLVQTLKKATYRDPDDSGETFRDGRRSLVQGVRDIRDDMTPYQQVVAFLIAFLILSFSFVVLHQIGHQAVPTDAV